ncbi:DNA-binding protein inhibitor ID-2-A isoform 2 [Schistosoma japonicum]|uniref:DNA-binding protein inhibitor ID-2-A isoform 2 n=1 Tax=Schistosoma japonicum TaxID=6182 RepID=A0A4Z2DRI7_SCHJA|nr:DNA-binding protein inhibitor ID-2-A isoform 2 [Schistosoma japonicum]TNN19165.1 DNA-binding protein inhibitor ID-2-A isoform 2 [Schistosoma japonicum]TNN19166.1 DNA-binding protein inhibitor ID-2-A isoform 2 [Schistosoma japonicum]
MTRRNCRSAVSRQSKHRKHTNSVKIDTPPTEMKRCLVKLKKMVPTIERNKKVNQLELLQHVIDYIQDLEKTLQYPEDILTSVSVSKCSSPKENLFSHKYLIWYVFSSRR